MMDNKKEQTAALVQAQQSFFASGKTLSTVFRKEQLKQLRKVIISHQKDIEEALHADLGKAPFEAYETEIGLVLEEISYAIRHVASWARPKRVSLSAAHFPAAARIYRDPHGVVLIMSPWNYPFLLTMAPLISAIAAGNCAIVKPSRYSLHTSELIISLIADTFDQHYIAAVSGGRMGVKMPVMVSISRLTMEPFLSSAAGTAPPPRSACSWAVSFSYTWPTSAPMMT